MKPIALVLDRDAGTRKLLDVLLTRFGYEVDRVGVTADALTLLQLLDYDFILSDDVEVAQWLSDNRPDGLSRMMILTSALEAQLQRMQTEWVNVRIIRKPFELADVIDACQAAAANRPPRQRDDMESFWRTSLTHGAKSGVVVRRVGNTLELVTKFGYAPGAAEQWYPMPLNQPYPICIAVRHGRPVWMASLTGNDDYPLLATVWQQQHTRALAIAPIVRGGEVIGAAAWTFREPQRFSEAEQRAWLAIADAATELLNSGGMVSHTSKQAGA